MNICRRLMVRRLFDYRSDAIVCANDHIASGMVIGVKIMSLP